MGKNRFLKKLIDWEYWPSYMFYTPLVPYLIYLSIRARNFTFYSAANPGIKSSGNGTESKYTTLNLIPYTYKPKSIFVPIERNLTQIKEQLKSAKISYPIIAKPDVGFRGIFVKKLYNHEELDNYLKKHPINLIIQDFVDLPYECGVFYHKYPGSSKGKIISLTLKSYMYIVGNGKSTVQDIVQLDPRAQHYAEKLREINLKIWHTVPENGKKIILSEIGNHARGTQFFNGNHEIDAALESTFNLLSDKIPGFFYGRFDIKYESMEQLKKGENFKFLEVNGIIAEPTHIYDATKGTYFGALKTIKKHWFTIYKISLLNHQQGIPYMRFTTFWKEILNLLKYYKKIKRLSYQDKNSI